jgi:thiol-disulfide isomerase/thioredoxin
MRLLFLTLALYAMSFALDVSKGEAPKFRAKTLDGETLDNESLKGKVVLIQFWTTWCGYCRADEPAVEKLSADYGDNLVVLAVDVNESRGKVKKYLEKSRRKSKIVLTEDTNLAAAFEAKTFPMYVVLDRKGKISDKHEGTGTTLLQRLLARAGLELSQR